VVDIVIAPNQAFERLRIVPTWGWAFLGATVLGMIGLAMTTPAALHALSVSGPAMYAGNPQIAALPPAQQQTAVARALGVANVVTKLQFLFVPFIVLVACLITAVVMLIANAVAHGDGSFKKLWALAVNVTIVTVGIGLMLAGLICLVRGAASFDSVTDVQHALPSLALLVPGAGKQLVAFLATFNVVQLWGTALLALGMTVVARIPAVVAWTTALVLLFGSAALGAAFAR
jgi:hypothetical protein